MLHCWQVYQPYRPNTSRPMGKIGADEKEQMHSIQKHLAYLQVRAFILKNIYGLRMQCI